MIWLFTILIFADKITSKTNLLVEENSERYVKEVSIQQLYHFNTPSDRQTLTMWKIETEE